MDTIQTISFKHDTIPMICGEVTLSGQIPKLRNLQQIRDYRLIAPMAVTKLSELWFVADKFGELRTLKAYRIPKNAECIEDIMMTECANLVPVIEYFTENDLFIEISPYYKNGSITGKIPEEKIKTIVLPGIISALENLQKAGIVHNDIKPENIFWSDDGKMVLLGDYGSVSYENERPDSFTPAYTDPFVLNGENCSARTDWFSVGLTLASIFDGKPLIKENTVREVLSCWTRPIHFNGGSAEYKRLVNGMINIDKKRRLGPKTAKKWCRNEVFGGEARQTDKQAKKTIKTLTVRFEEPILVAVDIAGLIEGIKTHWNEAVFLFQQGEFDRFLTQFDARWSELCAKYHKHTYPEIALFQLSMDLLADEGFIWRGREYSCLQELEDVWYGSKKGEEDVLTFLQRGQIEYYLKRKNADEKQINYAADINRMSRNHPEEAVSQLFISLSGDNAFHMGDAVFYATEDIVQYLYENYEQLDDIVDNLMNNKKFEAWLTFLGMGRLLDEIRKKCKI